jgi:spermidine synthase
MTPDRMAQVRDQLGPLGTTPVNRDLAPVAYSFDIVLWSAQFGGGYASWFQRAARVSFTTVFSATLAALLLAAIIVAFVRAPQRRVRFAAAYCTAATGFTLMALQVFLLLGFQAIYGYVYHQLAILIGLSMAGIALGSWLGMRRIRLNGGSARRTLATTQLLLALSVPASIMAIALMGKVSGFGATWVTAQCVFPALAALAGMLGGYQFPLAAEIFLLDGGEAKAGQLYAIDLLGGCAGALLLCTYLIPVFGFWRTGLLCATINLAPALLAARVCQKRVEG